MITANKNLSLFREYLKLDLNSVEKKIGMEGGSLIQVEKGIHHPPDKLIEFYANELGVSPSHLLAIIKSKNNSAISNLIKNLIYKYFSLVMRLRKYENP